MPRYFFPIQHLGSQRDETGADFASDKEAWKQGVAACAEFMHARLVRENVAKETVLMTDEAAHYKRVADMLGQKTIERARHYSRRADRTRKLTAVIANFNLEVDRRRTEIVKAA